MDESVQNIGNSTLNVSNNSQEEQSTFGDFFKTIDDNVQKMTKAATSLQLSENKHSVSEDVNPKLESINEEDNEDEMSSIDISVPSTYSSVLNRKKKEKVNMTNLYIERIFRGFHKDKHNKAMTVSSGIFL